MRKSVAGIAWDQGRVFIAQRSGGGAMGERWEFPGGKVEEGETDQEALIREYREEFAVSIQVGPFLGSAGFEHQGIAHRVNSYRVSFLSRDFTLSEHSRWRWAGFDEIEQLDFVDSDRKLLPALKLYFKD
jgi:8-oxo-dGTP diphosphatase